MMKVAAQQSGMTSKASREAMRAERFQHTIRHRCHVSGRGYWSGTPISMCFQPAEPGTGIVFRRIDLAGRPLIKATASNRRETALRTQLMAGNVQVEMVEHVMAALYALQIDNCLIEVNASEMPGLDGSAFGYVCALMQAGREVQPAERMMHVIDQPFRLGDENSWVLIKPAMQPTLSLEYRLDYGPQSAIGTSTFACELDPDSFVENVASARTFLTQDEARGLQSQGIAKHVTYRDLLVFDQHGPIDNTLRFSDECARHKLLDLIGDIALCGVDIAGHIVASRSGHVLNGRMAAAIENLVPKGKQAALCAA